MDHYTKLAAHYDEYYYYSDDYINYFTNKIVEDLPMKNNETIVEMGSGTGILQKKFKKNSLRPNDLCGQ